MTDTAPGQIAGAVPADLVPPPPPAPEAPAPDVKPKRPTTRAGRQAAAAARKAAGTAKPDKAPKSSAPKPRKADLETRLTGTLTSLGLAVSASGAMSGKDAVQDDGVAIISHAPSIAEALAKVAKNDPRVAAALERMLTAGVWSGLIAATLPLVVTIGANHGAIPESVAGLLAGQAPEPAPASGPIGVV